MASIARVPLDIDLEEKVHMDLNQGIFYHQNSPPLDSFNCNRSQAEVKGMKGSSFSLNKEKSNSKNCNPLSLGDDC
ncbi:hypothetical protein [Prochlorococcus marinus]|uniref:hypothetical protein n=1 Tax=Prochlorococcus marinus TaxID=1219 RepID=UPI0039B067C7